MSYNINIAIIRVPRSKNMKTGKEEDAIAIKIEEEKVTKSSLSVPVKNT